MDVSLEIRHLKLLAAVAEEESVTAASKRLHVTQSALSHQLRDAEERLGTPLFLRLGKRMALTAAGNKLLESARRILLELEQAECELRARNGKTHGLIRLSTECYTCYHWLPPLLAKFHARFPSVELSIHMEATNNPVEELLAGRLDVAIINTNSGHKSLQVAPLCNDEMMVIMSPENPLAARHSLEPQDLARETLLLYPPREESTLLNKVMLPAGVEPYRIMEIPLTEAIVEMAAAGVGVAFLARWAVSPQLESGKVVARSMGDEGFRRCWYVATLRNQPRAEYLSAFLQLITSEGATHLNRLCASAAAL